jgi:MYXO-CTERM domain-containing protein
LFLVHYLAFNDNQDTSMKSILFAAAMVLAGAAQAGPIKVVYSESATEFQISGSFTGTDLNNDGFLKLGELASWAISFSPVDGLTSLNAFGDYDIVNNVWIANATGAYHSGSSAFATWHNWQMSVSAPAFAFTTVQVPLPSAPDTLPTNPVPEPASLALGAAGVAAATLGRRRRTGRA